MSTTTAFLNVVSPRPSRWSSSAASTSSMSSTFSDLETHSLHSVNSTSTASSSSPPGTSGSKTNAFFASPFNTRPPSPVPVSIAPQVTPPPPQKPRSLTADFFATPVKPPSPPPTSFRASTSSASSPSSHSNHGHGHRDALPPSSSTSTSSGIHPSHLFPSRYTSISTPHRSPPQFTLLTEDDVSPYAPGHSGSASSSYHYPTSTSTSSSVLFASPTSPTFNRVRLPTPPPPPHPHLHDMPHPHSHLRDLALRSDDRPSSSTEYETYTGRDEPTPRPANREPSARLLNFERSLLLERQKEREEDEQMRMEVQIEHVEEQNEDEDEDLEGEEEVMREGSIITLPVSAGYGYGGGGGLGAGGGASGSGMSGGASGLGGGGSGLSPPVRSGPLPISPLALAFVLPDTGTSETELTTSPTTTEEGSGNEEVGGVETPRDGEYTGSEQTMLLPSPPYRPKHLAPSLSASTSTSSNYSTTSSIATSSSTNGSPIRRSFGANPHGQAHTHAYNQHPHHPQHQHQHHTPHHSHPHHPYHAHAHQTHHNQQQNQTQAQNQHPPQLRLLRPLGHGAFSAVWLAEDMSRVPLTLVSRKSVRDLRRRASERSGTGGGGGEDRQRDRERERERDKEREKERERQEEEERLREWEAVQEKKESVTGSGVAGIEERGVDMDLTPRPPSVVPSAVGLARLSSLPSAPSVAASSPQLQSQAQMPGSPQLQMQMQSSSISNPQTPTQPQQQVTTTPPPTKRHQGRLREGLRSMLTFSRGSASSQTERKGSGGMNASVNGANTSSEIGTPALTNAHISTSPSSSSSAPISVSTPTPASPLTSASTPPLATTSASAPIPVSTSVSAPAATGAGTTTPMDDVLMRDASLRKFRARVRGTRPALRLAEGRMRLDERDGAMGVGRIAVEGLGVDANSSSNGVGLTGEHRGGDEDEVLGANLARKGSTSGVKTAGRLVAVKMTVRRAPRTGSSSVGGVSTNAAGYGVPSGTGKKSARERAIERARVKERQSRREEEERTRVRFVREVEVLKHISHPNITPLLAHLSTATHHILVLPYLPGGDLLGLVNNDVAWGKLSESVLRRIWIELCKAVGWMHGVGLVHRDIKLENILLTTPTFNALTPSSPPPHLSSLPTPPAPFIKLTDFGLSRFVELSPDGDTAEMLSTRCGSEAYAAPELVTGGGEYDARRTDAWACGVVLYALVGRGLPFGEGVSVGGGERGKRIGGERGEEGRVATPAERRHWLVSIARGEWEWPGDEEDGKHVQEEHEAETGELIGKGLVRSVGARRLVERLLVRDPKKRARIADLWDEPWMSGGGGGGGSATTEETNGWWRDHDRDAPTTSAASTLSSDDDNTDRDTDSKMSVDDHVDQDALSSFAHAPHSLAWDGDAAELWKDVDELGAYTAYASPPSDHPWMGEEGVGCDADVRGAVERGEGLLGVSGEEEEEENVEEEVEDGCLLDQEGIDSITRQEVV